MNFTDLLKELKTKTFQEIIEEYNEEAEKRNEEIFVECIENEVYEDEDLYVFFNEIGAKMDNFFVENDIDGHDFGKAIIFAEDEYYKVRFENRENRFGDYLPDETMIFFDKVEKAEQCYIDVIERRILEDIKRKQEELLLEEFNGTELCPWCGMETDFRFKPMIDKDIICEKCGKHIMPCSLCDSDRQCGCDNNCQKTIKESLIYFNGLWDKRLNGDY